MLREFPFIFQNRVNSCRQLGIQQTTQATAESYLTEHYLVN